MQMLKTRIINDVIHNEHNHRESVSYEVDESGLIRNIEYHIATNMDASDNVHHHLSGYLSPEIDSPTLNPSVKVNTNFIIGNGVAYAYFNGLPALIDNGKLVVTLPNQGKLSLSSKLSIVEGKLCVADISINDINRVHSDTIKELCPELYTTYPTGIYLTGDHLEPYHYNSFFSSLRRMAKKGFYLDKYRDAYPGCDDVLCALE